MPFRPAQAYARRMTELDHIWSQMLDGALTSAGHNGRRHVAEYLQLKATNDVIRVVGVGWLFDTMLEIAGPVMDGPNGVTIEREEPSSFTRGTSNMVGSLLRIRQGVRCLTVEAGWARTPVDGIMQKGALVFGRITHFGMPKAGGEIRLVHGETLPQWLDASGAIVDSGELSRHLAVLLGA